jgi:hypothetical protein
VKGSQSPNQVNISQTLNQASAPLDSGQIRALQVTAEVGEILSILFGVWVCLLLICMSVYFLVLIKRHDHAEDVREAELAALKLTIAEHEERAAAASHIATALPQIIVLPAAVASPVHVHAHAGKKAAQPKKKKRRAIKVVAVEIPAASDGSGKTVVRAKGSATKNVANANESSSSESDSEDSSSSSSASQ